MTGTTIVKITPYFKGFISCLKLTTTPALIISRAISEGLIDKKELEAYLKSGEKISKTLKDAIDRYLESYNKKTEAFSKVTDDFNWCWQYHDAHTIKYQVRHWFLECCRDEHGHVTMDQYDDLFGLLHNKDMFDCKIVNKCINYIYKNAHMKCDFDEVYRLLIDCVKFYTKIK